jgi:hypothetical protein
MTLIYAFSIDVSSADGTVRLYVVQKLACRGQWCKGEYIV